MNLQMTGEGPKSPSYLIDLNPDVDLDDMDIEEETFVLLPVLRRIEVVVGGDGAELSVFGLKLLLKYLNVTPPVLPPSEGQTQRERKFSEKIAGKFREEGGIQLVTTLLLSGSGNVMLNPQTPTKEKIELLQLCLEVLCQLCDLDKDTAVFLGEIQEVLIWCFHQLDHKDLSSRAAQLIKPILLTGNLSFNLCSIPNLSKILGQLEGDQVANICKFLSITVSDMDILQKKPNELVKDVNQELLLSVPGFLSKLVNYSTRLPYKPRFVSMPSEIDQWMRFIDDHISDEIALEDPFMLGSSSGGGLAESCSSLADNTLDRVEIFYVLGILLTGKYRKQVQKELSEIQLIPKLNDLFDNFIWRSAGCRQRNRLGSQVAECECSPEVTLKIQFLRLVHTFCDSSQFKHLLLSRCEWQELSRIPGNNALVEQRDEALVQPDSRLMCRGTNGLLVKIVEVLKKEPATSSLRFWLCRAVESYLRGRASYPDQIFLIRRGLLQHITASILQDDAGHKEAIQSSFDLLSEMVKFNYDACKQMDDILNSESKMKKCVLLVKNNLVDSNMFIRAIVLSHDYFMSQEGEVNTFAQKSTLFKTFCEFNKQVLFVVWLVGMLQDTELNQENVSCLNTSVLILLLASRKGLLPVMLRSLLHHGDKESGGIEAGKSLLRNLKKLLLYWQKNYLHKDKDCSSLEKSSLIPFAFWKMTVEQLLSENNTFPTSICHYTRDWRTDPSSF